MSSVNLDNVKIEPGSIATLPAKALRRHVLSGMAQGRPLIGPQDVHIDLTNGCNAACITCWDHSPLLDAPRTKAWKRQRLSLEHFNDIVADLAALGSVRAVVLSGMGEPLTHPRVYEMMATVKALGWHLTVLSNLVAADIDRLLEAPPDNLLVGVHGATPAAYTAFHPGWTEQHFFTMCKHLRRLSAAGVRTRHVQVINRDTAPEVVAMVRFGRRFGADRVNFKLASLAEGTQACALTPEQRDQLLEQDLPRARALAEELGVHTNLALFEQQLRADKAQRLHSVPISEVGCAMGYVYTRVTVEREVLYCCNTNVSVGRLDEAPLSELWWGERWQALRERLERGDWFAGCERCGKFEQNLKWAQRREEAQGRAAASTP